MGFSKIKKIIFDFTPDKIKKVYQEPIIEELQKSNSYNTISYSQEGEDLILKRIFEYKTKGFYIDVGAHHPKRFSNTYLFYKTGWRGINIDATPGSMNEFKTLRPRDVNLELGVSDKRGELIYYEFDEPALNTFSRIEAIRKNERTSYKIINELKLKTFPLSEILTNYLEPDQNIDFLNIDVEGFDFKVLRSLDFEINRPEVILIESLETSLDQVFDNEIYQFLMQKKYILLAKTFNTLIFKKI